LRNNIALTAERQDKINNERHHGITLERKIQDICSGLKLEFSKLLYAISEDDAFTIGNYIEALRMEVNPLIITEAM